MTNKDRQNSLETTYGYRLGNLPCCEWCEFYTDKCVCIGQYDSVGTPCATAYNRMTRKQNKDNIFRLNL